MATLADIRQKYPQYGDMSDLDLANAIHKKFYADMPRVDFDRKLANMPERGQAASSNFMSEFGARIDPTMPPAPTPGFAPSHRQAEDLSMVKYQADPPKLPPASQIERWTGGMVNRGAAQAVGGGAGGLLSAPAAIATGPFAPAVAVGGMALGAAGGGQAYDLADEFARSLAGRPTRGAVQSAQGQSPVGESFKQAGSDLLSDAVANAVFGPGGTLAKQGYNALKRKMLGVTPEAAATEKLMR